MFRYPTIVVVSLFLALASPLTQVHAAQSAHDAIAAAIADPARPDADRKQDANRKSQEVLEFAGAFSESNHILFQ